MNKLTNARRAAVVRGLVEGGSVRAVGRRTGTDKDTVLRILVEVGEFCSLYQHHALRNLNCTRIECDEIWSFVGAKEANRTNDGQGDLWTFTAICADSKLALSWLVGPRSHVSTRTFVDDVASRLAKRVQITTDAFPGYLGAVERSFGWAGADFATVKKLYGQTADGRREAGIVQAPSSSGSKKSMSSGAPT